MSGPLHQPRSLLYRELVQYIPLLFHSPPLVNLGAYQPEPWQ